jgi:acyl-CoA reductase-like NAD-dependent aldehyde dehydrogenase
MFPFSPIYIDNTVDMGIAVRRILWGKCVNAGQTCIAPDYVLCSEAVRASFVAKAKEVLEEWYGSNVKSSPDFGRIASDKHFTYVDSKYVLCVIQPYIFACLQNMKDGKKK